MDDVTIGEKIQKLIDDRGTSQSEAARRIGIAQSRLNQIINGKGRLYVEQAFGLARVLDVPLEYLADDAVDDPPPPARGEWERKVWEIVREIGPEAAWRRLVRSGEHPRPADAIPAGGVVQSFDPETGQPIGDTDKRRRGRA